MKRIITALLLLGALLILLVSAAVAQYGNLDDTLVFGNPDGSVIDVCPGSEVVVPVWLKSDDSLYYLHLPLQTDNNYIVSRDGGHFYPPVSLWDDVSFLWPNAHDTAWCHRPPPYNDSIQCIIGDPAIPPGYTSQSIRGFAYLSEPRDPQNFLYTGDQWWYIADYYMTATSDASAYGDASCMTSGHNPQNQGFWLDDPYFYGERGLPTIIFGCFYFDYYAPGDANNSCDVNGLDVVYMVSYLKGINRAPYPLLRADANGDCAVNGLDVTYLVSCLKGMGPAPVRGDCP